MPLTLASRAAWPDPPESGRGVRSLTAQRETRIPYGAFVCRRCGVLGLVLEKVKRAQKRKDMEQDYARFEGDEFEAR